MDGIEKLEITKELIEQDLGSHVASLFFNDVLVRLRIVLQDGTTIIIYFNDHDQYSYSIIFSSYELDRCRFDNFDDTWKVSTTPHHFHPRTAQEGLESPMDGAPRTDIPRLCELIRSNALLDPGYRF
jgi:hypothetical protein